MQERNNTLTWQRILAAVLDLPGVKVDRTLFLRQELHKYCSAAKLDMIEGVRPYTIVSDRVIDTVASKVINRHTTLATTASTIAGLPGGFAMAATIPGDILQYYYHVVVLSQKLAYLYGFPDFCDEEGNLGTQASDLLTIFMGSMMGVKVADQGITEIARSVAFQTVGRLPRLAISKAAVTPVVAAVVKVIGVKLSKEGLAKGIGKFIPIAGGLFSGSVTLFTFRPGAIRLQKRLKAQKAHFSDGDIDAMAYSNIRASFQKAEQSQNKHADKQRAIIEAMINLANINGAVSDEKYKIVEHRVATSSLDTNTQLELLASVGNEESRENDFAYDVDYDILACDAGLADHCMRELVEVAHAGGTMPTMAERMYLTMAAKTLGVDKERLDALMGEKQQKRQEEQA